MDKETENIVANVKSLLADLRTRGVTESEIDSLLAWPEEGRIRIDSAGRITLPDYGGVSVYLNPMERTLYTLLLRYPQGIPVDDLYLYYDELCRIYMGQTTYDDEEMVKDAVGALVDEDKGTLYTNVSRIKRKMTDKLGRRAAPYIISRDKGIYCIKVPRSLVSIQ